MHTLVYHPNKMSIRLTITTLTSGWNDRDSILLHACFQLLVDCVEKEHLLSNQIDWNYDPQTAQHKQELEALYAWWKARTGKAADEQFDPQAPAQYDEDTAMLARLVQIRGRLWT